MGSRDAGRLTPRNVAKPEDRGGTNLVLLRYGQVLHRLARRLAVAYVASTGRVLASSAASTHDALTRMHFLPTPTRA